MAEFTVESVEALAEVLHRNPNHACPLTYRHCGPAFYEDWAQSVLDSGVVRPPADVWDEALDAVAVRADDGIEFGPKSYLLLLRILRDVRSEGAHG